MVQYRNVTSTNYKLQLIVKQTLSPPVLILTKECSFPIPRSPNRSGDSTYLNINIPSLQIYKY